MANIPYSVRNYLNEHGLLLLTYIVLKYIQLLFIIERNPNSVIPTRIVIVVGIRHGLQGLQFRGFQPKGDLKKKFAMLCMLTLKFIVCVCVDE